MRLKLYIAALCFLPVGLAAHADDLFTITGGGNTLTFTLPASPVVASTFVDTLFDVSPVAVDINGTTSNHEIAFYTVDAGTGISIQDVGSKDDSGSGVVIDQYGAVLFTGALTAPTFTLGTYHLSDQGGASLAGPTTLTISSVPEPSAFALLGTGMLSLIGAVRRRTV